MEMLCLLTSQVGEATLENAGRKSSWQHGETQTIRVPKVFARQLIQIARRLDNGEEIASDTKSKLFEIDTVTDSITGSYDNVTQSTLAMTEALIQAQAILKGKRSARASRALAPCGDLSHTDQAR